MNDPYLNYWEEAASCALDDAGISATGDQIKTMAKAIKISHECYGQAFGHEEADKSCRMMLERDAKLKIVSEVEKICGEMGEDSRFVDYMTPHQKMALATLFNLRKHLRRHL